MSDIMNPAMLSHAASSLSIGKFIKGFCVLYLAFLLAGEMAYDGDFTKVKPGPEKIARTCTQVFRASPVKGSFAADVTPAAAPLEGASSHDALGLLRDAGFTPGDATAAYAGRMFYNDRVLLATRDASHMWPELIRSDTCSVTLFLRHNRVTGAFAQAVRQVKISALPHLENFFPKIPVN